MSSAKEPITELKSLSERVQQNCSLEFSALKSTDDLAVGNDAFSFLRCSASSCRILELCSLRMVQNPTSVG